MGILIPSKMNSTDVAPLWSSFEEAPIAADLVELEVSSENMSAKTDAKETSSESVSTMELFFVESVMFPA
jgi:hypothetical protein